MAAKKGTSKKATGAGGTAKARGAAKTGKAATGAIVNGRLAAFSDLSWLVCNHPEDIDESVRARSAGVPVDTLRIHHPSTRFSGVYFSRTHRKARKLTVGDVLERIHEFYSEVVPPDEAAAIARAVERGKESDAMEYIAEHLLPDPEGPLHMLPPDEYGHVKPSWTTERCDALLSVYRKEAPGTSGDTWKAIQDLLASYRKRGEPFPLFPPRKKPPCVRRSLMGDAIFFEGLAVLKKPGRGLSFTPDAGVLDVSVMLGS